MDQEYIDEKT